MLQKKLPNQTQADLVAVYRKAVLEGKDLSEIDNKVDRYLEKYAVTAKVNQGDVKKKEHELTKKIPRAVRWGATLVPLGFISVGFLLLGNALLPIANYYVNERSELTSNYISPIPETEILDVTPIVLASSDNLDQSTSQPIILDTKLDYTNLANWFTSDEEALLQAQKESVYTIDIPSVKVSNAQVKIGGTNLNDNLIQYPETAMPGEYGAPVIFGHSVLRQFYNPSEKNPRRYNSIFSYIMTLKVGDEIFVTHNGVKYTYVVREKTEVKPEDVHILTQNYSAKQLKLVTCTPEGTYLRRGVVTAELIDN